MKKQKIEELKAELINIINSIEDEDIIKRLLIYLKTLLKQG